MQIRLWYVPTILLGVVTLHFVALYGGIYQAQIDAEFVWWDNILHGLVGAAFALGWLWFVERAGLPLSPFSRILSALVVVMTLAVAWEFFEYGILTFVPETAHRFELYSTSFAEATTDSLSNVIGAAVLLVLAKKRREA